jgi:hypothetical protein
VSKFRQSDLTRALQAAISAGLQVESVEIDPSGKIIIMTGAKEPASPANALDKWMTEHANQA